MSKENESHDRGKVNIDFRAAFEARGNVFGRNVVLTDLFDFYI